MTELKMTMQGEKAILNKKCYFFDCGEVAQTISKIYGSVIPIEGFIANDSCGNLIL